MTVKYFGKIAELTKLVGEDLSFADMTVAIFREELVEKYPELKNETIQIAVNLKMEADSFVIKQNDTVAILPPFSGG